MVSRYVSNFTLTGINPANPNGHPTHHVPQMPLGVAMTSAPPGSIKGPNNSDYHVQQCLVQGPLSQQQQQQHQTHPHYRIVHSRADAYHVTTPTVGFPSQTGQQQQNQQIRGLPPSPATPPTQDIKPSISLHSFVQRGQQSLFRNSQPNQSNQRGANRGQPTLIQQQFISALPQNFVMQNYQIPHSYNAASRQTQSQLFSQSAQVPYQPAPIQSAYTPYPYYYPNPQLMQQQRPVASQQQQSTTTTAQTPIALPAIQQLSIQSIPIQNSIEPRKRRQHAICIVDPMSGKDVLDEILSGEQSQPQQQLQQQPVVITTTTTQEIEQQELLLQQQQQQQQLQQQLQVQQQQQIIQQQLEQQKLLATVVVPIVVVVPIEEKDDNDNEPVDTATPVVSAISDGPDITPRAAIVKTKKIPNKPIEVVEKIETSEKPKEIESTKPSNISETLIQSVEHILETTDCNVDDVNGSPYNIVIKKSGVIVVPYELKSISDEQETDCEMKERNSQTVDTTNNNLIDEQVVMKVVEGEELEQIDGNENVIAETTVGEIDKSIPANLIDYNDGQWSPVNPDGKKYYTREQLIKLMETPKSKTKPCNLPDSEISLKHIRVALQGQNQDNWKTQKTFSNSNANENTLMPTFARSSQNQNRGSTTTSSNTNFTKRLSQTAGQQNSNKNSNKNSSKSNQMIHVRISLNEDVKLSETENAWKPSALSQSIDLTEEQRTTAELFKKVRSILNKLTPEKFDHLASQLKSCNIDSSERLLGVIELIFEKAVDEPNFSVAYAKLCAALCNITVQVPATQEDVSFKKRLLVHCQSEFERIANDEKGDIRLRNIDNCQDPEKRAELEEEDRKFRRRSVGTVRFIGELFKIEILTPKIMHTCILLLLNQKEQEESLECLCKLMTTVGEPMESRNEDLEIYIKKIKAIVDKKSNKVSSRVRFMLQDVIDLRKGNWIPRRTDNNPKTISQIQKEAAIELQQQQIMNYPPPRKDDNNRRGDNRLNTTGYKHGGNSRQGANEDGWSTTQTKNRTPSTFDPQKLNVKTLNVDSNTQLGQASQFKWNTSKIETPTSTNMYAALSDDARNDSSRNSGGSFMPPRETSYEGRRSQCGSQKRSRDDSSNRMIPAASRSLQSMPRQQQQSQIPYMATTSQTIEQIKPETVSEPEITEKAIEQIQNSLCTIVEEYFSGQPKEEFTDELKKLVTGAMRPIAVRDLFNLMLEKSKKHRLASGEIIVHMFVKEIIRAVDYEAGLQQVLDGADDISIDVPKIWDYLAELVAPALFAKIINFQTLAKCGTDLLSKGHGKKFLSSVIKFIDGEFGPMVVRSLWGGENFANFMDATEVEEFVTKNNLGYLTSESIQLPVASQTADLKRIETRTKELFSMGAKLEVITSWLDANIATNNIDKQYIRALSTSIFQFVIKPYKQSYKLDCQLFETYTPLLSRYIKNKEDCELECLYALQRVIHLIEHPQGILRSIVDNLYEFDIISLEGFMKWKDSKNPLEQEGKGVAVTSLVSFFTVLQEQGETSGDEAA